MEETRVNMRSRKNMREEQELASAFPPFFVSFCFFIFSLLLSFGLYANPIAQKSISGDATINRFAAMMMGKGGVPYLDFVSDKGPIFLLLSKLGFNNVAFFPISLIIQILIYFISMVLAFSLVKKYINNEKISFVVTFAIGFLLSRLTLGGEVSALFVTPLLFALFLVVTTFFYDEKIANEMLIVYGMIGGLIAFIDSLYLGFWLIGLITIFVINLLNQKYKTIFYQLICLIFGGLLITFPVIIYATFSGFYTAMMQSIFSNRITNFFNTNQSSILSILISFGSLLLIYGVLIAIIPSILNSLTNYKDRFLMLYFLINFVFGIGFVLFAQNNSLVFLVSLLPFLAISLSCWIRTIISWRVIPKFSIQNISTLSVVVIFFASNFLAPVFGLYDYATKVFSLTETPAKVKAKKNVATFINSNTKSNELFYVLEADSNIYTLAKRRPASNYILQNSINFSKYPKIEKRILSELKDSQPRYIVLGASYVNNSKIKGLEKNILDYVNENYQFIEDKKIDRTKYYIAELKVSPESESEPAVETPVESNVSETIPDDSVTQDTTNDLS